MAWYVFASRVNPPLCPLLAGGNGSFPSKQELAVRGPGAHLQPMCLLLLPTATPRNVDACSIACVLPAPPPQPVQKRICRGQYDAAKMAQVLAAGGTQARLLVAAIMAEGDPCPSTSNDLLHAYQHPNTERNFSEAAR